MYCVGEMPTPPDLAIPTGAESQETCFAVVGRLKGYHLSAPQKAAQIAADATLTRQSCSMPTSYSAQGNCDAAGNMQETLQESRKSWRKYCE
jgi:hypothetical protein